jgi:DNA polymerase III delta prime subunit
MHHAYLYFGSLSLLPILAKDTRERFGFVGDHNPDVQLRSFEKFGIDEARELQTAASLKSSSGRALYIVGVSQITTEAQQALLKLFEEPQGGTVFVVLAPHGAIIPTLRSRFLMYPSELQKNPTQSAASFLKSSYKIRSAEITKLLKDEEGARERARDFLVGLEQALYAALQQSKNKKDFVAALEDIAQVRNYLGDRSPSLKMLFEHLALALPTIK